MPIVLRVDSTESHDEGVGQAVEHQGVAEHVAEHELDREVAAIFGYLQL